MTTTFCGLRIALLWIPAMAAATAPPATAPAPAPGVTEPGAKVVVIADTFAFTEGPAVDANGNLFFTDQPGDRILKLDPNGKISTFLSPAGRANGLYFDRKGNLLACADEKNELWSIAPDKKVTVLVRRYDDRLLNGPNDLWVRPDGGVYFTDPFYKRGYWKRGGMEQGTQGVYFLSADRKRLIRVGDDYRQPNGIIGTPDGKALYVADIGAGKTWQYAVRPDGTLADKKLFCPMGSDGMTIDAEGNVYLTGKGVTVFDKAGRKIEHIPVPAGWTANVTFGGKDLRTLYITAGKLLCSIRMRASGAKAAP